VHGNAITVGLARPLLRSRVVTVIRLWQHQRFSCVLAITNDEKRAYELWLQHDTDIVRERTHWMMEAAVAEANLWHNHVVASETAAMARSTPY
jgi:hypothetical protein